MKRLLPFAVFAVSACAVGPDYSRPSLELPANFRAAPADAPTRGKWWTMFDDPTLNMLEEKALASNLSIEAAKARLDQARAAARARSARLAPSVSVDATAARLTQSQNAGFGQLSQIVPLIDELSDLPASNGLSRSIGDYQVGTTAIWELDFAGGLARQADAARAEALGANAAVHAVTLSVSGELAESYLAYRYAEVALEALGKADSASRARVEIMAARVHLGTAPEIALERANAQAKKVSATLPLFLALREGEAARIAVMIGQSPSSPVTELADAAPIPVASAFGAGAPADLLRYRPDLVMAEYDLIASNSRIGAALSEYYPRISISALFGFNSIGIGSLFEGGSFSAQSGGALQWRLFDFGRIDAEVAAARGRNREALAEYRAAVLRATAEVETAFVQARAQGSRLAALTDRLEAFAMVAKRSDQAFSKGAISRDDNLADHYAMAMAEVDLARAQLDSALAAIAARRALGS